jgi:hypothetical protein
VPVHFRCDGALSEFGQRKAEFLRLPVQVLRKPDVVTLGMRTSYVHPGDQQAGSKRYLLRSSGGRAGSVYAPTPADRSLRGFWALETQRIIPATALIDDLRKCINAQRLGLSTCKAGALPTELRPRVLISINVSHQTRKNTYVMLILSPETAQRS